MYIDDYDFERIKQLVYENYSLCACADSSREACDTLNYYTCFERGKRCGKSWMAYKIGSILGIIHEYPNEDGVRVYE